MSAITLTHASVNGGVAVDLGAADVSYGWKNLTKTDPVEGKFDISETDYSGFENPIITIRGVMDVDDATANQITQALLIDFALLRSTTPITLTVQAGGGTANKGKLRGRPAAGYSVGGSLTTTMKVVIDSFDISFSTTTAEEGQRWDYSITLQETT